MRSLIALSNGNFGGTYPFFYSDYSTPDEYFARDIYSSDRPLYLSPKIISPSEFKPIERTWEYGEAVHRDTKPLTTLSNTSRGSSVTFLNSQSGKVLEALPKNAPRFLSSIRQDLKTSSSRTQEFRARPTGIFTFTKRPTVLNQQLSAPGIERLSYFSNAMYPIHYNHLPLPQTGVLRARSTYSFILSAFPSLLNQFPFPAEEEYSHGSLTVSESKSGLSVKSTSGISRTRKPYYLNQFSFPAEVYGANDQHGLYEEQYTSAVKGELRVKSTSSISPKLTQIYFNQLPFPAAEEYGANAMYPIHYNQLFFPAEEYGANAMYPIHYNQLPFPAEEYGANAMYPIHYNQLPFPAEEYGANDQNFKYDDRIPTTKGIAVKRTVRMSRPKAPLYFNQFSFPAEEYGANGKRRVQDRRTPTPTKEGARVKSTCSISPPITKIYLNQGPLMAPKIVPPEFRSKRTQGPGPGIPFYFNFNANGHGFRPQSTLFRPPNQFSQGFAHPSSMLPLELVALPYGGFEEGDLMGFLDDETRVPQRYQ